MKKKENTIRRYEALVRLYLKPWFGDRQAQTPEALPPHRRLHGLARERA
jgi:hypothetical protein